MQYELQIKKRYTNTEITFFKSMFHVACFISLLEDMVLAISIYYRDKRNHMILQLSILKFLK